MLSVGFNPTLITNLYATPNNPKDIKNIIAVNIGFFIFISSFFLAAVNISISLYFEITKVLKIITKIKIIPKYKTVFKIASVDNKNL